MAIKTVTNTMGKAFRLGRNRPRPGPGLSLCNYMLRTLPKPPVAVDYSAAGQPALSNIYGNDTLGDCVIAGIGHVVATQTGNAGDLFTFSDQQIISLYSSIGGYVPGDPSTDNGCDEVTALNHWAHRGAPLGEHKITGWLWVNGADLEEVRTAMWLFENLYFGVELPDEWVNQAMPSSPGFTWDVAGAPGPNNGHCVVATGYGPQGIQIDTWGLIGTITDAAIAKYMVPAAGGDTYVVIAEDSIAKATGKAPNGFDWSQLVADFVSMGGRTT
jgi:hypothetical protein